MAKVADIITLLPIRAQGVTATDVVRILNTDIRPELDEYLSSEYFGTYQKEVFIPIDMASKCSVEVSASAGNVDNGVHRYKVSFIKPDGETQAGEVSLPVTITDNSTAGQVSLTDIPLGGEGATARNIYRQFNGTGEFKLLTTISDNTTTTYTDNTANASLGVIAENGFPLPSDFNYVVKVTQNGRKIPERKRNSDNRGNQNYYWLDFSNNPDSTASQVLSVSERYPYVGTLNMTYKVRTSDANDTDDLPYPLSLHDRLLPVLALGVAFYHLSELPGQEIEAQKVQARYNALKGNVFGYGLM